MCFQRASTSFQVVLPMLVKIANFMLAPSGGAAGDGTSRAGEARRLWQRVLHDLARLLLAELVKALAELGALVREDGYGEEGGVGGARLADGQGAHGNAARHLHGGKERVHALERCALHGHAEHR